MLHPATGVVNISGKPAFGILVRLQPRSASPDAPIPTALTGVDGHFTLNTAGKPGAPEGIYAITLTWPPPAGLAPGGKAAADRLEGRYATRDRPFSEVTIQPGTNELSPFDLQDTIPPVTTKPVPRKPRR
jgi:hypothetical protein